MRSNIYRRLKYGFKYKNFRKKVIKHYNNRCSVCGKTDEFMTVHHKIPLRDTKILYSLNNYNQIKKCKLLWKVDWHTLLCQNCHRLLE